MPLEILKQLLTSLQPSASKIHRDALIKDAKYLRTEMSDLVRESPLNQEQKRDVLRQFEKTMGKPVKDEKWDIPNAPSERTFFVRKK